MSTKKTSKPEVSTVGKVKVYKALTPAQFKKLSVTGKRIAIAKDVIAAVNGKIYIANKSTYIDAMQLENEYRTVSSYDIEDMDVQKALPKIKKCEVCALGSCIMSITKYENKLKFGDLGKIQSEFSKNTDNVIKDIFTPEQFAMMEIMFEGWYTGVTYKGNDESGNNYGRDRLGAKITNEVAIQCIKFSKRYKNDNNRLKAIMANIITNKGEIVL